MRGDLRNIKSFLLSHEASSKTSNQYNRGEEEIKKNMNSYSVQIFKKEKMMNEQFL